MSNRDAERTREAFEQLLELPANQRDARLDALAETSPDLAPRVRKLLKAHERAEKFGSVLNPGARPTALPETIGPYRLLDRIGEGGMGVVYLAEQKLPVRRRVAIKVIQPGMASPTVIRRFEAERQALAMMNHPGIAGILDGGETEDGLPYFVMEYVQGTPLLRYCDSHRLDIRQRLQLLRRIALAVQHAHQKGVIHRDLKPSNILVTEGDGEPQPKIIDFGVAKALFQPLTSSTLHTRSGAILGTPEYMSPEQCASSNVDVDTRSDVYALGALMYHLLTGVPAHSFSEEGLGDLEIMRRLAEHDPPTPSRRALEMDEAALRCRRQGSPGAMLRLLRGELDWITMRAMARDRNRRYESAQALADDIEKYLSSKPVAAGPPSVRYLLGKFVRRHTLATTVFVLTFLFLGASSMLMYWQVQKTRVERDRANREAAIAREVTSFTAGLFEYASPTASSEQGVSARELLDAGVRRLQLKEVSDPVIHAALLGSAGNAYLGLDAIDEARPLLDRSLELRERHQPGSTEHVDALLSLSDWFIATSDFAEAERIARAAFDIQDSLTVRTRLAVALRNQNRLEEASRLLEPATQSPTGSEAAEALLELGRVRIAEGNFAAAEKLISRSVAQYEQLKQGPSAASIEALDVLGEARFFSGNHEAAAQIFRSAIDDAISIYGEDHSAVGILLNNLGASLYMVSGPEAYKQAEAAYRRALVIQEAAFGRQHVEVANVYNNIGNVLFKAARYAEAVKPLEIAIDLRRQLLGANHPDTLTTQLSLAISRSHVGQLEESIAELRTIVAGFEKELGRNHWRTANALFYLAQTLQRAGDLQQANKIGEEALQIFQHSLGPEHIRTLKARKLLDKVASESSILTGSS